MNKVYNKYHKSVKLTTTTCSMNSHDIHIFSINNMIEHCEIPEHMLVTYGSLIDLYKYC